MPTLDPPETLPDMVREIAAQWAGPIVIVDDGSNNRTVFDQLKANPRVVILHHKENLGRGEALKTAFRYLLCETTVTGVLIVDGDGGHLVRDVFRVHREAKARPETLILGTEFASKGAPFANAPGNRLTTWVQGMLTELGFKGAKAGLCCLPKSFAETCLSIPASRYEFEIEMLSLAQKLGVAVIEVPIVIHIKRGPVEYFRVTRDSTHAYMVFLRFSFVAVAALCVDVALFALFHYFTDAIFASTYAARFFSGVFNLLCNRSLVFHNRQPKPLMRDTILYVALAICVATASGFGVRSLSEALGWPPVVAKLIVDPCIFLFSFTAQRLLIFRS